ASASSSSAARPRRRMARRVSGGILRADMREAGAVNLGVADEARAAAQRERQLAPTSRSVLVSTSCTSRTFGPLNISRGGRLEWASAKSLLSVQATKSAKVRHQVFTS